MTYKKELGTVIVTGASRGIGAAVAMLAGGAGYAVAVNFATSEAEAGKVVDAIMAAGGRAVAIQADVSREAEIIRMFQMAEQELGPIKGLVNSAGVPAGSREWKKSRARPSRMCLRSTSAGQSCVRGRRCGGCRCGEEELAERSSTFLHGRHTRERRGSGCTMRHRRARLTASRSAWRER